VADYLGPNISTTDNSDVNLSSGVGPYFNAEIAMTSDVCGDVPAQSAWDDDPAHATDMGPCSDGSGTCVFTYHNIPNVTIKCVDTDNDSQIDIGACVSWDNLANTNAATSCGVGHPSFPELDTNPGTSSKCNCNRVDVTGLLVPGSIIVDKVTVPSGDPTLFPFTLTGPGTNVSFSLADATTPQNTAVNPGTYSVAETPPAGWAQISATCSDASPINAIVVGSGEIVTCTFWNGQPTAVKLRSFTAEGMKKAITLKWESANETNTLGFNLYRAAKADGEKIKLNAELIPSSVPGSSFGAVYEWTDATMRGARVYYYWVEEVGISGGTSLNDPVIARAR
jgi:hypothetical protein